MAAPIPFEYHQNAQQTFKPPLIANENAFLGDVATSESRDATAPISAGFYRLEKGECFTLVVVIVEKIARNGLKEIG